MSKKENALGSIPTFENVARATEDLDLFKDANETKKEEVKESKEDLAKKLKEEMKEREDRRLQGLTAAGGDRHKNKCLQCGGGEC